jgi:hypothetical protein
MAGEFDLISAAFRAHKNPADISRHAADKADVVPIDQVVAISRLEGDDAQPVRAAAAQSILFASPSATAMAAKHS